MPAWGGRIPEYQIWQIMAFIQSMNGQQPTSAKEEYSCARED
jgi:cytochrome c oxidase cbb3-type subunit 3